MGKSGKERKRVGTGKGRSGEPLLEIMEMGMNEHGVESEGGSGPLQ